MTTVAVLNEQKCLVGVEDVADDQLEGRVVVDPEIDLPMDGSFWWDEDAGAFVALSQLEALRPSESPVPPDYAVFLALRALLRGAPMPDEVHEYAAWYEAAAKSGVASRADNRARATHATAAALQALVRGEPMPDVVREYVEWYDQHERPRSAQRAGAVKRLLRAPRR